MTASSGGCQTCKLRRVKCDAGKPICQRCIKSKRICVEAHSAKQASFSIHSENRYASGVNKRPRGPRSNLTVPPRQLDLATKALEYYHKYHLQVVPDTPCCVGGLAECVVAWKASGRSDAMVDLALSAMALAVYSRTQNDASAADESNSKYYQLLQMAQIRIAEVELPTLQEQDIDACALTVFLMGRYEGVMHPPGKANPREVFQLLQSWSHHEGALAILKVWYDSLSHSRDASEIIKQTRRGQVRSAILRNRMLPEWIRNGERFGEQGLDLEYDRIIIRTVLLRGSLACLQRQKQVPVEKIKELNEEAEAVHTALDEWLLRSSYDCPRSEHVLEDIKELPRQHFYSRNLFSYSKLGYAAVHVQYLTAQMLVLGTQLKIFDLWSPDSQNYCCLQHRRAECIDRLHACGEELAANVPFCLERFTLSTTPESAEPSVMLSRQDDEIKPFLTTLLFWALSVASSLENVDQDQQSWFRSEIACLGSIVGDSVIATAHKSWHIII